MRAIAHRKWSPGAPIPDTKIISTEVEPHNAHRKANAGATQSHVALEPLQIGSIVTLIPKQVSADISGKI